MAAAAWRMAEAREEEHHLRPNMPSSIPSTGECNVKCGSVCVSVCVFVSVCGGFEASVWRAGELLAVLVFVVDDAFEPQASEVLEHEVVVLGDAAERRRDGETLR